MKQKIFNSGRGWYISATNYKDSNDKAYMNLYFPKGNEYTGEPEYQQTAEGYMAIDIDIQEARFTSYHNKIGLTVFKYDLLTNAEIPNSFYRNDVETDIYTVQEDDLPFY